MKLKTKKLASVPKNNNEIEVLRKQIKQKESEVSALNIEIKKLKEDVLTLELAPYSIGEEVLCEVPVGKTRKECTCVIECEDGCCYVRPYKNDGTLSGRRFSITPIKGKTYADYFRAIK